MSPLGIGRLLKGRSLSVEELQSRVESEADGWQKDLFGALEHRDLSVRIEAAKLAYRLPVEEVKEPLLALLREDDVDLVIAALGSIGNLRIESAVPAVTGLLGRQHQAIKQEVARCLTRIGGTKGATAIGELLDTPRLPSSSEKTIKDLGMSAIPALMSALMDGRRWVRQNAAVLLGIMGDRRSVASLMVALNDEEPGVRAAAVDSLGQLGGKDAVSGLMSAITDSDERVRIQAASSLGKAGTEVAVVPLITLFADDARHVRDQAVKALVDLGACAVPALVRGLQESESGMREYCARTLSFIKSEEAMDPLLEILEDNEWSVRRYAAEALGKLGNRKAIPYLLGALTDPIDFVRERAQQALDTIDPTREYRGNQKPIRRKKWQDYRKATEKSKDKEKVEPGLTKMDLAEAYDILGITLDATREHVRNAWRSLMRRYHPDVVRGLPEDEQKRAEEEAKRVNVAYSVLMKELKS